ncbi:MAG TPA: penicillin-binding transpeptidase domain-containing protein [Candidatus Paceibacterota bacterium]|nr:penicillin-binding transpeptidase domain-containing protein [Candidatus Paceibacterota bacterium]
MTSWWGSKSKFRRRDIDPEDIFLDATNRAGLDPMRLEGRIERPVSRMTIAAVGGTFGLAMLVFAGQAINLQIVHGSTYADISRNNHIDRSVIFAPRGVIYDRTGTELAWNSVASSTEVFAERVYINRPGFAHILGFVRYPKADARGEWWREEYIGVSGVEGIFDDVLAGENGDVLAETNAQGAFVREDIVDPPVEGDPVYLSIDADVQAELARILQAHARNTGFVGGAAAIMDVHTGELLALTSFPEYDQTAFSRGDASKVQAANSDPSTPLLNRAVSGLYTPGSIVKPIFAAAALNENIIDPSKRIFSAGSISIPNPYNPSQPSIFRDWKAHGWTDMRRALAVSSDVYFYAIGGGFEDQRGLGIERIDDYARRFGLGELTGFIFGGEAAGVIPTPEWKEEVFDGDPWRLGDTYNTAIGQYGFQITPLQAVRFAAAIANGGYLVTPQIEKDALPDRSSIGISDAHLQVVRDGMRAAVTDGGTAAALNIAGIDIAGKTGTAQVGMRNQYMNSWVIGFWPASSQDGPASAQGGSAKAPKYAFAVVLERAPAGTLSGAAPAMSQFFYWLRDNKPEYVE